MRRVRRQADINLNYCSRVLRAFKNSVTCRSLWHALPRLPPPPRLLCFIYRLILSVVRLSQRRTQPRRIYPNAIPPPRTTTNRETDSLPPMHTRESRSVPPESLIIRLEYAWPQLSDSVYRIIFDVPRGVFRIESYKSSE